jgi:hypothetical protein
MLPLLNLVLFGNPRAAQSFYRESYATALDVLTKLIRATLPPEKKHLAETSAKMYFGQCLAFAIASRLDPTFDLESAARDAAQLRVIGLDLHNIGGLGVAKTAEAPSAALKARRRSRTT